MPFVVGMSTDVAIQSFLTLNIFVADVKFMSRQDIVLLILHFVVGDPDKV